MNGNPESRCYHPGFPGIEQAALPINLSFSSALILRNNLIIP
jgi:hypothetical protein